MITNKKLSLYLDNVCNLKCGYCNVDYSKKRTFTDEDLYEWFSKNGDTIDRNSIKLCGGEPTVIYLSIFDFLDKEFKRIFMITNLYDSKIIEKWVERFGNRLDMVVSIHDEVVDTQFENILKFKDYIRGINIVVSHKNMKTVKNYVERIFEIGKRFDINLLPELPYDDSKREFDKEELLTDLNEVLNTFSKHGKLYYLSNTNIVNNVKNGVTECDFARKVSIFLDGKISPCVCNSPFFISFKDVKTPNKNNKYDDCKTCRKCTLFTCNDGYINNSFDYEEFCFISKRIYDFCLEEEENAREYRSKNR